jgi:two-component system autoinducer 2 sensor kinase/phosphatase LuxQ
MEKEKSKRILIAEDIETNRIILTSFLKSLGYINVTQTRDGLECLRELTKNEYDILLLDNKMPHFNGCEIATIITNYYYSTSEKKHCHFMNIKKPIMIVVTAYYSDEYRDIYKKFGFNGIISKPLDKDELRQTLEKFE